MMLWMAASSNTPDVIVVHAADPAASKGNAAAAGTRSSARNRSPTGFDRWELRADCTASRKELLLMPHRTDAASKRVTAKYLRPLRLCILISAPPQGADRDRQSVAT